MTAGLYLTGLVSVFIWHSSTIFHREAPVQRAHTRTHMCVRELDCAIHP